MENYCDRYDKVTGEIFFQRDPGIFTAILSFHTSGKLHIPRSSCYQAFVDEAKYWGIPVELEPCCDAYLHDEWECAEVTKRVENFHRRNGKTWEKRGESDETANARWGSIKRQIWDLFENPETSIPAKVRNKSYSFS